MHVIKRNGINEKVSFDRITARIQEFCYDLNMKFIQPHIIAQKVINGLYNGITTIELDNLAEEITASLIIKHPDYDKLAARIAISNLHKQTDSLFSDAIETLYRYKLINENVYYIVRDNIDKLNSAIIHNRDFNYTYFGFKTLQKSYLLKIEQVKIIERPQFLLMRVALGIHGRDVHSVLETYELLSTKKFVHASPTLFSAGTNRPQLSSCFLLSLKNDSVEGIFDTLKQTAQILKYTGGIGLNVHDIRANGSGINNNQGTSNGIVPVLKVFNESAKLVDQGGNKRPGAIAVYLEPWHRDIFDFLRLKKNTGKEERRARELFYALWIPDLFMKRVEENLHWTLVCPQECPGLSEVWGLEFEKLYENYEREKHKNSLTINARQLWKAIIESQIETGTPYMLYKDTCNSKSNQQHLGTIKSSNLCAEIIQYSSSQEIGVCNLASIALNSCIVDKKFDFKQLYDLTKIITKNLNKIIDINLYPLLEAKTSNKQHRPIGIGVQGLADVFLILRYPFESEEARQLNFRIFETVYYAALEASCELARSSEPYESYIGSPASKGILQIDMYDKNTLPYPLKLDWTSLRNKIAEFGLRNSLLIAVMPTATTAQILGNNESIEPYTNNIYIRRVLSGEFQIINRYLLNDLIELELWNDHLRNEIILNYGSIQSIKSIPEELKRLYKTAWEISQRRIITMAIDRAFFVDQSQSLNIFLSQPTYKKLTNIHFYTWKHQLKTGMYYLRSRPAANPIQFTIDQNQTKKLKDISNTKNDCIMCNS